MIVGFVITSFNGHEDAAVDYIRKVCVLDEPDMAQNIVNSGVGVNVFSDNIELGELRGQPFSADVIEVSNGECLIVSIVEFNLEVLHKGVLHRLRPTEYLRVPVSEAVEFSDYIRQNLVRVIPSIKEYDDTWLLSEGKWSDEGDWIDSSNWDEENE